MGCAPPLLISTRPSHHLSHMGLCIHDILPHPILWRRRIDGPLCLPYSLRHLARYRNRVWVDSDTTCHKNITISAKGRFDGVCTAIGYKHRTISLLIWCEIFYLWQSSPPNPVTPSSYMGPLRTLPVERVWRDIWVGTRLVLILLFMGPLPSSQKADLMGCATSPLISQDPSITYLMWYFLSITVGVCSYLP